VTTEFVINNEIRFPLYYVRPQGDELCSQLYIGAGSVFLLFGELRWCR